MNIIKATAILYPLQDLEKNSISTYEIDFKQINQDLILDCDTRDFTMNAMYYNVVTKEVSDLHNSVKDIKEKTIRTV